jgi:hypothetical protein
MEMDMNEQLVRRVSRHQAHAAGEGWPLVDGFELRIVRGVDGTHNELVAGPIRYCLSQDELIADRVRVAHDLRSAAMREYLDACTERIASILRRAGSQAARTAMAALGPLQRAARTDP